VGKAESGEDWIVYMPEEHRRWDTPSGPTPGPYTVVGPGPNSFGQFCPEYDIVAPSRDLSRWTVERIAQVGPANRGDNMCLPLEVEANANLLASSWEMCEALVRCLKYLKEHEWSATSSIYGDAVCPCCGGAKDARCYFSSSLPTVDSLAVSGGHRNNCSLSALISEIESKVKLDD
jgi:hypothetical protein